MHMSKDLLDVCDLSVEYRTSDGTVKAVNGLDLRVGTGEASAWLEKPEPVRLQRLSPS